MAATALQPDLSGQLGAFLLRRHIASFQDRNRDKEESVASRMELEAFILSRGANMLRRISRALQTSEISEQDIGSITWYAEFATSLDQAWLEAVDPNLLARAWRMDRDRRRRSLFLELMVKQGWIADRFGAGARLSPVVNRFEGVSARVRDQEMTDDELERLAILFHRAELTDAKVLGAAGSLGGYCVQLARYCFDPARDRLAEARIDLLLAHTQLTGTHLEAVRRIIQRTS